jgi:hypothetical protein
MNSVVMMGTELIATAIAMGIIRPIACTVAPSLASI